MAAIGLDAAQYKRSSYSEQNETDALLGDMLLSSEEQFKVNYLNTHTYTFV